MKFEDDSQNLRVRMRVLQILILLLISVLGVRLYVLQMMKGSFYAERAENAGWYTGWTPRSSG